MQPSRQQPNSLTAYTVPPALPMRPGRGRRRISLWVWLISAMLALLCFLLVESGMAARWENVVMMWFPFLVGIGLLLVAGISALVGMGSLLGRPSGQATVFALCCLGVFVGAIWRLGKAATALWIGVKGLAVLGGCLLLTTPWGLLAVGLLASLDAAIRHAMENSTKPEWRMIQVEYAGTDSGGSQESISFVLTNSGGLDIASMEGTLHVWNSRRYASADLPIRPEQPLKAGQSVRLSLPLDENGRQFLDVIRGIDLDSEADQPAETQPASGTLHLRYQLRRLTVRGQILEVRGGNIEPPKEAPAFGFQRGLDNAEWRLVGAEYLGMDTQGSPGRAAFRLIMPRQYEVAWLKGKLQVIDFERGSVEKQLELQLDAASSTPVIIALDAGRESELANQIITSRMEFDRAAGNAEQTTYIVRFQLQEMKTADGKAYSIDWMGELNEK